MDEEGVEARERKLRSSSSAVRGRGAAIVAVEVVAEADHRRQEEAEEAEEGNKGYNV